MELLESPEGSRASTSSYENLDRESLGEQGPAWTHRVPIKIILFVVNNSSPYSLSVSLTYSCALGGGTKTVAAASTAARSGGVVIPDGGLGSTMVPWTTKPGEKTPQERADDKAKHRWTGAGVRSRTFLRSWIERVANATKIGLDSGFRGRSIWTASTATSECGIWGRHAEGSLVHVHITWCAGMTLRGTWRHRSFEGAIRCLLWGTVVGLSIF